MRPLDGIVILDLTRFLPGAVGTMLLLDQGAEVIKIERPGSGDPGRDLEGASWLFQETNRGKKSVALDLRDERGRALFLELVAGADVVVESFRPRVMARLGLDYERLRERNPRLIYAALSGYGRSGPNADMAGHDINFLAMSGVLDLIVPAQGEPTIPDVQIADIAGGSSQIVIGILLALLARGKTGRGTRVDVSLCDGLRDLLTLPRAALRVRGQALARGKELVSGGYACYNVYRAKDGRWLAVGALERRFWANLCAQLGCGELADDQYTPGARQDDLKRRVAAIFLTRTADEWFAALRDKDCCVTPIRTLQEALQAELPAKRETTGGRSGALAPAPLLGEHSMEILARSGATPSQMEALVRDRVVQVTARADVG